MKKFNILLPFLCAIVVVGLFSDACAQQLVPYQQPDTDQDAFVLALNRALQNPAIRSQLQEVNDQTPVDNRAVFNQFMMAQQMQMNASMAKMMEKMSEPEKKDDEKKKKDEKKSFIKGLFDDTSNLFFDTTKSVLPKIAVYGGLTFVGYCLAQKFAPTAWLVDAFIEGLNKLTNKTPDANNLQEMKETVNELRRLTVSLQDSGIKVPEAAEKIIKDSCGWYQTWVLRKSFCI